MNTELLVERYLPLVKSIAAKYRGLPFEDLVQEGLFGVLEAAKAYDETRDTAFGTYAYYHIKKRILAALKQSGKEILMANPELRAENDPEPCSHEEEPAQRLKLPEAMPEVEASILRYSFEQKLSLKAIALKLDLRVEKVRYLKAKALRRYKNLISTQN